MIHVFVGSGHYWASRKGFVYDLLQILFERLMPSLGLWPWNAVFLEDFLKCLEFFNCILSRPHTKFDWVLFFKQTLHHDVLRSRKTLHMKTRLSTQTSRDKLATGCIRRVGPPYSPTGFTPLRWIVASQLNHAHYFHNGPYVDASASIREGQED